MKLPLVVTSLVTAACGVAIVDEAPVFAPDAIRLEVAVPGVDFASRPARGFSIGEALGAEYIGEGQGVIDPTLRCDQLPYGGPDGPSVGRLIEDGRSDLSLLARAIFAATRGHVPPQARVELMTAKAAAGAALLTRLAIANLSIQIKDRAGRRVDPSVAAYAPVAADGVTRLAAVIAASGLGTLDGDARRALDDALRSGSSGDPRVRAVDPTTGTSAVLRGACFDVVSSLLVADFLISELAEQRLVKPFRAGWVTSVGGPTDELLEETLGTSDAIVFSGLANERISLRPLAASAAWSLGDVRVTAVLNAASFESRISPGSLAVVLGEYGAEPGEVRVTIGGVSAELSRVASTQLEVLVPDAVATGPARVAVRTDHGAAGFSAEVVGVAPGLFTTSGTGSGLAAGQAIVVGPSGSSTQPLAEGGQAVLVPATAGDATTYLALYGTGFAADSTRVARAQVLTGGAAIDAPVTYAGAQGQPGLSQLNVVLPAEVGSGPAKVVVEIGEVTSNAVGFVVR